MKKVSLQQRSTINIRKSGKWGIRAEKGHQDFCPLIYGLKKGESYTLTMVVHSKCFSVDYNLRYNTDNSKAVQKVEALLGLQGWLNRK